MFREALQLGLSHHQEGRLDMARHIYQQVLAADPGQADAHHLLGVIAIEEGNAIAATECIGRAIALNPGAAGYHLNLARAQSALGLNLETAVSCRRALELEPDLAEACLYLGNALLALGKLAEAASALSQAIALRPGYAAAHHSLGVARWKQGDLAATTFHFQKAIELEPRYATAHNSLGAFYLRQNRLLEAQRCLRRALELRPDFAKAESNLGIALLHMGRLDEAARSLAHARSLQPDLAEAWANFGLVRTGQGRLEEATAAFRRAAALQPESHEARRSLMMSLLLRGCYEEGWRAYEGRPLSSPAEAAGKPKWRGEPAAGKTLLVLAEQGFGDVLQFVRFAGLTGARRVILECQPELARLLASNVPAGVEVSPRGAPLPDFDFYLHLLSLPLLLGKLEPWSPPEPYLQADPALRAVWRERLGPREGLRVGLTWQGSSAHELDRWRSISFRRFFGCLAAIPGVRYYNLQFGDGIALPSLVNLTAHLTDFADTAALVAELDLIVSVDTSIVHLAGALGRPVWTLLSRIPDWRWGAEGESTPWYPSMRLFRQQQLGNWSTAFKQARRELSKLSAADV